MCAETMDDHNGEAAAIPNNRLIQRLQAKGLSPQRFATAMGVDVKTVRRWLADFDYNIREDNARRAATLLGCTPHDLWPNQYPPAVASALATMSPNSGPFTATLYASRTQLPITAFASFWARRVISPGLMRSTSG